MEIVIILCLCGVIPISALFLLGYLLRKGFDFAVGCLGNLFILGIAGVLLVIYLDIAEVDICAVWLVGEPICSIINNF